VSGTGVARVAFVHFHGLRSSDMPISWLNHTPHAIAVNASWPALLGLTWAGPSPAGLQELWLVPSEIQARLGTGARA